MTKCTIFARTWQGGVEMPKNDMFMCNHDRSEWKPVEEMRICGKGMRYCMELVESGEMEPEWCEKCIIEWLCDDPIETCMNPEDQACWYHQCTRPASFWADLLWNELLQDENSYPHQMLHESRRLGYDCIRSRWVELKKREDD